MKTVLFYQHFGQENEIRGAHYKTFDFFCHIKNFAGYKPMIYFDESSIWNQNLPWFSCFKSMPTLKDLKEEPDILFLNSGKDWIKYTEHLSTPDETPIISPVNNFRALNPKHKSFEFLSRKAIRLCPSLELYEAVKNHPSTNGETIYLPNGVGIETNAQDMKQAKNIDLLIIGLKNKALAHQVFSEVAHLNICVELIDEWIPKKEFQRKLAESHISVHLPKKVEEHYIPGVEAMMLGSLVIIPDCVGNRSYSKHLETCFLTEYNLKGIIHAIHYMINIDDATKQKILFGATQASEVFLLNDERTALLDILKLADEMW